MWSMFALLCLVVQFAAKSEASEVLTLNENIAETYGLVHPILRTTEFSKYEPSGVTPALVREMMNLAFEDSSYRKGYRIAESDFSNYLCTQLVNKSRRQVVQLAGQPWFKGEWPSCWSDTPTSEVVWIYYCGSSKQPIRLLFDSSRCLRAEVLDHDTDEKFEHWRAGQICNSSLGKTQAAILEMFGKPPGFRLFKDPLEPDTRSMIYYRIGSMRVAQLKMVGNTCLDTAILESSR